MPALAAEPIHLDLAQSFLDDHPGLAHLRLRRHGQLIVLESGPKRAPVAHARLRRVTRQWWALDVSVRPKTWEPVPGVRAPIPNVLKLLVASFPWLLAPRD